MKVYDNLIVWVVLYVSNLRQAPENNRKPSWIKQGMEECVWGKVGGRRKSYSYSDKQKIRYSTIHSL